MDWGGMLPKAMALVLNVFLNTEEIPKTTDLFGSNKKASFQGLRNVNFQNILRLVSLVSSAVTSPNSVPFPSFCPCPNWGHSPRPDPWRSVLISAHALFLVPLIHSRALKCTSFLSFTQQVFMSAHCVVDPGVTIWTALIQAHSSIQICPMSFSSASASGASILSLRPSNLVLSLSLSLSWPPKSCWFHLWSLSSLPSSLFRFATAQSRTSFVHA